MVLVQEAMLSLARAGRQHGRGNRPDVSQSDGGRDVPLPKDRYYLEGDEEAPPGVVVQTGPRAGRYYEVDHQTGGDKQPEGSSDRRPTGGPDRSARSPGRAGPSDPGTPEEEQSADVSGEDISTVQRIRIAMAAKRIPTSPAPWVPGYDLNEGPDGLILLEAHGHDQETVSRVSRAMDQALIEDGSLEYRRRDDGFVVQRLSGDEPEDAIGEDLRREVDLPTGDGPKGQQPDRRPPSKK